MIEPTRQEEEWFGVLPTESEEPSAPAPAPEPEAELEPEEEKDPATLAASARARTAARLFGWALVANLSAYLFAFLAARGQSLELALVALIDLVIGPIVGLLLSLVGLGMLFSARRKLRALPEPKQKTPRALYRLGLLLLVLALLLTLSQLICLSGGAIWLSQLRFPNPRL